MQELIKEKLEPIVENIAKSKDLQYDLRICYDENRMFCIGFKKGDWVKIRGSMTYDNYEKEDVITASMIEKIEINDVKFEIPSKYSGGDF